MRKLRCLFLSYIIKDVCYRGQFCVFCPGVGIRCYSPTIEGAKIKAIESVKRHYLEGKPWFKEVEQYNHQGEYVEIEVQGE